MKDKETVEAPVEDARDEEIAALRFQLADFQSKIESLEEFANAVIGQRNECQTQSAQYYSQVMKLLKQQQQGN